jgi:flavin reductase (DIM6/NTAB) family NADH-FMN oxidoreductase RutF
MKKINLLFLILTLIVMSCNNSENKVNSEQNVETSNKAKVWKKIKPTEISDNVIKLISEDWMLITAGNSGFFNTMTASWGFLGEIWGKNASVILVRDTRYTHEFLESNDSYTLSFFPEDYRAALSYCGSVSGRDTDKVKESGLTAKELESGLMSFEEARLIIECKKMYSQPFLRNSFVDINILENIYADEESIHTMYFGEIINVWIKE